MEFTHRILKQDVVSYKIKNGKKEIWVKKGDMVKVINIDGEALIIETVKGERFPAPKSAIF